MSRAMVKLIHADNFYPDGDAERYTAVVQGLGYHIKSYGLEIDNFNMIFPGMEPIFSKVLGERVKIDHKRSGVFRKPLNNVIHWEHFDSINDWCFVVALEKNTINFYHHVDTTQSDPRIDAETALDGSDFNYSNLFEWHLHTNVLLQPNQGVFFRPWTFHSLDHKLVQYYRLVADNNLRILVAGPSGKLRKNVARKLHQQLQASVLLSSLEVRKKNKDLDWTEPGLMRHAYRMLTECRSTLTNQICILEMACPLDAQRQVIMPDLLVWCDTGATPKQSVVEKPSKYDFQLKTSSNHNIQQIVDKITHHK